MIHIARSTSLWRGLLLFAAMPLVGRACSCINPPTRCDRGWNSGEFVFAGFVVSKVGGEHPIGNGLITFADYEVHFSSTEVFRGAARSDEEATVYTGHGGGDCGYPFVVGQRYLVYASKLGGRFTTSICSETAPEIMASATIRQLRNLRDHGHADKLFGNVGIAPPGNGFEDLLQIQPLPKVRVHVTGEAGSQFSTTTDDQGAYGFASLPSDQYAVEEDLPAGLHRAEELGVGESTVDLRGISPSEGCRVNAFAKPDGRIAGKVINSAGQGLAGFITLEPSDPEEAQRAHLHGGLQGEDIDDGEFSLPLLPPGRYRLIFHPKGDYQTTFYWPNGSTGSLPDGVDVNLGQHVDNVQFKVALPSNRK